MRPSELPSITTGQWLSLSSDIEIEQVFIDSRKHFTAEGSLFVALQGQGHDGHNFINELYSRGVRLFAVEKAVDLKEIPQACVFLVPSSIRFLQQLAIYKRNHFKGPVIGITGSNGKTIIKEWLYQVLSPEHPIIKSPGSYNSQIGVPLSVLPVQDWHTLGIFEAGISKAGEMAALEECIRPDIGVFTNLLSAHDEGFSDRREKAVEKAKLFIGSKHIVFCIDDPLLKSVLENNKGIFTWSLKGNGTVNFRVTEESAEVRFEKNSFSVPTGFTDQASVENLCHVISVMLLMGYSSEVVSERCRLLKRLPMRLEMKDAINGCKLVDDSYSNDLSSLKIALDFLKAQYPGKKALIISDLQQTGLREENWFGEVRRLIELSDLEAVVGIGPVLGTQAAMLHKNGYGYENVDSFLQSFSFLEWQNTGILVKGARAFRLEQVVEKLQRNVHGTVMEIDLLALNRNLNFFRSRMKAGTALMVMVKAFAYGSGAAEIARFLEHNGIHYLGVAYADEGVALRSRGIKVPVMVMNPAPESYGLLAAHDLEPAVFSTNQLGNLIAQLRGERIGIHLKLDTGMHRLGFEPHETGELSEILFRNPNITVRSVYTHLAASENQEYDDFSREQIKRFDSGYRQITTAIGYEPARHVLNTAGIVRFPEFHFEMVRLGIGLYGIGPEQGNLEQVVTLKTVISQIKTIEAGETVGYGRHGKVAPGTKIATIAIGYADGYNRAFGLGKGKVLINGKLAPTVGNICMDMTMVDISGIEANEGDEVIIYGKGLSPIEVSSMINTIPYELLTSTGDRVRRIFHSAG